jgi:hypothetical protein
MSALSIVLLSIAACWGFGARLAHAPSLPLRQAEKAALSLRSLCTTPHNVCAPVVNSAASMAALLLVARYRDALASYDVATQTLLDASTAQPQSEATVTAALVGFVAQCAVLLGLLLSLMATWQLLSAHRGPAQHLALRRLTEHRVSPAP